MIDNLSVRMICYGSCGPLGLREARVEHKIPTPQSLSQPLIGPITRTAPREIAFPSLARIYKRCRGIDYVKGILESHTIQPWVFRYVLGL